MGSLDLGEEQISLHGGAKIRPTRGAGKGPYTTHTELRAVMTETLAIIKPDATADRKAGHIIAHLEAHGFAIRAMRMVTMTQAEARAFYDVHRARPFFESLVAFMTSGPCIPMVLAAEDAVHALRRVIGATDPALAAEDTVRKLYAQSKERNAIHGSDSRENARREIGFFFAERALLT